MISFLTKETSLRLRPAARFGLLVVFLGLACGSRAEAGVHSNTMLGIPNSVVLADVDGDGSADMVRFSGNRLFVSKLGDFEGGPLTHAYFDKTIVRVVSGDFQGVGNDQVCPIFSDNSMMCFGISDDKRDLWWWFTAYSVMEPSDDGLTGDFDGDGAEDLLVYNQSSGSIRMYTIDVSGAFFVPMPDFWLGQVANIGPGMQLRAGDFNADGKTDLLVSNTYWKQLQRYDSTGSGFSWMFTTTTNVYNSQEQLSVARIDDDMRDDVVFHDLSTGRYRFFHTEFSYASSMLEPLYYISQGQLPTGANTPVFWAPVKLGFYEPGMIRDDAISFANGMYTRVDARWDPSTYTYTYWFAFTHYFPKNDWPAMKDYKWLTLMCKFSDDTTTIPQMPDGTLNANGTPHMSTATPDGYRNYFYRSAGGMLDYFREISHGGIDFAGSQVYDTWLTMNLTTAQNNNAKPQQGRVLTFDACAKAATTAGVDFRPYDGVIVVQNRDTNDDSSLGWRTVTTNVNGTTVTKTVGAVTFMPGHLYPMFTAHELGHVLGLTTTHSYDLLKVCSADGQYCDPWDIMSATLVQTYAGWWGASGPAMNAGFRYELNWLPSSKRPVLQRTSSKAALQTTKVTLAEVDHPEGEAPTSIFVKDPTGKSTFVIEYRLQRGWDSGLRGSGIQIRLMKSGDPATYVEKQWAEDYHTDTSGFYQVNQVFSDGTTKIKVTVNNLRGLLADVTVTY